MGRGNFCLSEGEVFYVDDDAFWVKEGYECVECGSWFEDGEPEDKSICKQCGEAVEFHEGFWDDDLFRCFKDEIFAVLPKDFWHNDRKWEGDVRIIAENESCLIGFANNEWSTAVCFIPKELAEQEDGEEDIVFEVRRADAASSLYIIRHKVMGHLLECGYELKGRSSAWTSAEITKENYISW